jgi:GT2 family glycosyltransferase
MNTNEPAPNDVDLSVILVNWNSLEVTSAALASLQEHTQGISYEVFVIDNGTTRDGGVAELPQRFPWIRFIANPENRGFTKANNQGIRPSRGRYVLLLNNDTVQIENALGKAVRYMDEHPEVGALGITHRNNDADRTFQPSFYEFPKPWQEIRRLFRRTRAQAVVPTEAPAEQDVDWVCGSFLLMRRACLEQVGELDERFFIYDEDIDWCLRAQQAGWKVRFWPGAAMVHLGAAANPFMKDKTLVMFRSHLSYIRKHHSRLAAGLYYVAMGLRLAGATTKQLLGLLIGRASLADLRQRWRRQVQFLFLRPGRVGG